MARPKKALITRERAVEAALDIIEREGLSDFSLGAVARQLGVKPPSLYHHFKDKDELLELVARTILASVDFPDERKGDWEERTLAICLDTRRALLRYPHAAPLILQFFPRYIMLPAYDHAVAEYPKTRELHMAILEAIEKLTYGSALFHAAARARGASAMPAFDAERYPNLAKSVAANRFDDEELFLQAMRLLIAGVRAQTADLQRN